MDLILNEVFFGGKSLEKSLRDANGKLRKWWRVEKKKNWEKDEELEKIFREEKGGLATSFRMK